MEEQPHDWYVVPPSWVASFFVQCNALTRLETLGMVLLSFSLVTHTGGIHNPCARTSGDVTGAPSQMS